MKFFAAPLLVLAAVATSVVAQAAGNDFVDDVLARDEFSAGQISAREFTEIHARHADEIFEAKRDLERLERRSRSTCYAACATLTGGNRIACWKKCDAIWGK
ncbi:hypothetical protein D9613_008595 [Agrocybe pediades]|uniref:Uncharacterized protein n=1 Tax=Agrocybe pediades TaxID=84607 RepID=A0A8H4VMU9_9AGAR|nr:hypothetical protein D9613_008595 [Agrocybe pediades]